MKEYLEVGKITNTHGIRGDLKIEPWCDDDAVFRALPVLYLSDSGAPAYRILKNNPYKGFALVHLEGIDTTEQAQSIKGKTVYAAREHLPLPEDRVFIADILGLPVIDARTGEDYGRLSDVSEGGAGQIYEIRRPDGSLAYFPAVREFIDRIESDTAIYINPPEGLFV